MIIIKPMIANKLLLEKVINSGRYGQVYYAKDIFSDQVYAVKALPKVRYDLSSFKNKHMIYNEITNMQTVKDHKNIVRLHEVLQDHVNVYLVEEWCDGPTLRNAMHEHSQYNNIKIALNDVIEAIYHCHKNNIVFCDLKPDNIIYSNFDKCFKVTDFGSSVAVDPHTKEGIAFTSTPMIAPPEIFDPYNKGVGAYVTFSYDVWSVGTLAKMLYQLTNKPNASVEDFISLCLEPSPSKRISTEEMRTLWQKISKTL